MERTKSVVLLGLIAMVVSVGLLVAYTGDSKDEGDVVDVNSSLSNSTEVEKTSDGTKYTVHPDKLVQGCPGMDCIPSIDDPGYVPADEADWLDEDARVIGLEIDGETRAYPLSILSRHEIVNDQIEGEPVAVTYCPLCRSGVTYSREVNGEVLEFGVSGKLHEANLVMYDRDSETYWNQITGKAIVGVKVPQELELIFSSITTWDEWKNGNPDTKVLSRDTGIYPETTYDTESYRGYRKTERVGFGVDEVDDRLSSKELVHGIKVGNSSKAYPDKAVEEQGLIKDNLDNRTVLVFRSPEDGTVKALLKQKDDLDYRLEDSHIGDSKGGEWSFTGDKIGGEGSMKQVAPQSFYWFAWSKFNPHTQVYKR